MKSSKRKALALTIGFSIAMLSSGLSWAQTNPIRVASKIDTEGRLLGNMIVLTLEQAGIPVQNRVSLGNTSVVRNAIVSGEIDLYPEYTGNGAFIFSEESNPAWRNFEQGHARVKELDYAQNRIVWLGAAPANNTWAIAVRQDVAQANGLQSLDDMARFINAGGNFKLAASAEFVERSDALPAFQSAYGFTLAAEQLLTLAGGDTTTTIRAAAEQTSGVNAAMAYGTDGPVAALGLVIMDDPRGVQPIYAPAPIIREDALQRHPEIADLLGRVFATLDGPTLQQLNARIQIEGVDPRRVASDHLRAAGLLN